MCDLGAEYPFQGKKRRNFVEYFKDFGVCFKGLIFREGKIFLNIF